MGKPLVAVVDWKPQPRGDRKCLVEKEAIGSVADVKYFLCDKLEDWKGQVLKADAILVWHNTKITEEVIHKLENCKAIVRNGTGYDTVDHIAAGMADISFSNVPDYGVDEVADHSIALALIYVDKFFLRTRSANSLIGIWKVVIKYAGSIK